MGKARVLRNFVATVGERKIRANEGVVIDLPPGVDWLRAGFVEEIEQDDVGPEATSEPTEPETAAVAPPEAAVLPRGKARKPKAKAP